MTDVLHNPPVDVTFYNAAPRKRVAAGVLFRNNKGHVLLVKPTYKNNWEIPGGITELDESPRACCEREVKEELGLEVKISDLLCVDYTTNDGKKGDSLQIVFDGGILSENQISQIKLCAEELREFRFFDPSTIEVEMSPKLRLRIETALAALKTSKGIYLENPHQ